MTDHAKLWAPKQESEPRTINIRKGNMVRLPNGFIFRAVEDSRYYANGDCDTVRGIRWIKTRSDWSRQSCIFSCKNYTIIAKP